MVVGMLEACLDDRTLVVQPLRGPMLGKGQLGQVMVAESAEFDTLQIIPDALVRIQVTRITR
jgi:hypothetical protein